MSEVKLLGILNLSYDSFSGDGLVDVFEAVARAEKLAEEGAWVVDVGAVSTRPGARPVSKEEELERVGPVLEELANLPIRFSIDTTCDEVARYALDRGASLINSINANEQMYLLSREYNVPVVIMHNRGNPKTMNRLAKYSNVTEEVFTYLSKEVTKAKNLGCEDLVLDPGLGFAKLASHSWDLLRGLKRIKDLGYDIMVGASRKGFAGKSIDGTIMANDLAYNNGATIFRVHDVKAHKDYFESFYSKT